MDNTNLPVWIKGEETAPTKRGKIKVKLHYLSPRPQSFPSKILIQHGAEGPFTEEVSVLLPSKKVYPLRECFLPAFTTLSQKGIIPEGSELTDYQITEMDDSTLAYVV